MAWNKVYPVLEGDSIKDSVTQIAANWLAIDGVLSAEHAALSTSLSGTHLYGRVSTMFSGSKEAITDLSTPATGALAWDTTCGVCRIYNGTLWPRITEAEYSRAQVLLSVPQAIAAPTVDGPQWTPIVFNTAPLYNSLLEYDLTSNALTIAATGWYLVRGVVSWDLNWLAAADYQKTAAIYVGVSTKKTSDIKYGKEELTCEVIDILNLTEGDVIYLAASHTNPTIVNASFASLTFSRLS